MTTRSFPKQQNWHDYFVANRANLIGIDWANDQQITSVERQTITRSIQQFQLGEQSEGRQLIELAEQYVARTGDEDYLVALRLFIAEEQRHAHDLGQFMMQQDIPRLQADPVDSLFRGLRRLFNLEVAIVVLLSAEVVACTYYRALHDATRSTALRALCRQILRDEVQHLNFQTSTLAKIRTDRSDIGWFATHWIERLSFVGVLLLVWHKHGPVYRAGGFSFGRFWQATWKRHRTTFARAVSAKR